MASSEQAEQPGQIGFSGSENGASRNALVATAVKFLQNPRVRQSPLANRRTFLKKKGLTDEEIDLAFQQSGTPKEETELHNLPPQLVPSPSTQLTSYSPASSRWRDYGALAVIMTGLAIGFHQLYKKYLLPLIVGGKEDRKQLQRIESNMSEMSGSVTQTVTQLQTTLAAVQELLIQQQQKIQDLTQELATSKATTSTNWILESQSINDLKSEIYSLKGLLLNRRQFPPSPSAPKILSWQIPVKPASPSNPVTNNHNTSSDISPVSNESSSPSPVKESHSPEGTTAGCHLASPKEEAEAVIDLKGQVRTYLWSQPQEMRNVNSLKELLVSLWDSQPTKQPPGPSLDVQAPKLAQKLLHSFHALQNMRDDWTFVSTILGPSEPPS